MNRKLINLIVGLIVNGLCNAQAINNDVLPSDRNHWTITVAYDASIPGKWKLANESFNMFKPGCGISVGADYMYLISKNFFLPAELFREASNTRLCLQIGTTGLLAFPSMIHF